MPTIEHRGKLIHEFNLPGERREDMAVPNHCNGMQLSEDRCLSLVSAVGYRGVDDARSIVYQLRERTFDGPVIREGFLMRSIDDWDPEHDGSRYVRQHGHPAGLGVPLGALAGGKPIAHGNVFAVMFRQCPRVFDASRSFLLWENHPEALTQRTQGVLIVQFRLNDARNDIEVIDGPRLLRQVGFEAGPRICERNVGHMNQSLSNPIPLNDDASEWVVVNHFGSSNTGMNTGGLAALRFRFNPARRLYEWVQTGPVCAEKFFEASIARYRGSFIVAGRPAGSGHPGWGRVDDPFTEAPVLTQPADVFNRAPMTAYTAADGVLRLFSGDQTVSPHRASRDPLYCWDIDPDTGFAAGNRRTVFDSAEANVSIARKHGPKADFGRLMPHVGGEVQVITHRVISCGFRLPDVDLGGKPHPLPDEEFNAAGVYHAYFRHDEPMPGVWKFH